jgi:hypothetical protein
MPKVEVTGAPLIGAKMPPTLEGAGPPPPAFGSKHRKAPSGYLKA